MCLQIPIGKSIPGAVRPKSLWWWSHLFMKGKSLHFSPRYLLTTSPANKLPNPPKRRGFGKAVFQSKPWLSEEGFWCLKFHGVICFFIFKAYLGYLHRCFLGASCKKVAIEATNLKHRLDLPPTQEQLESKGLAWDCRACQLQLMT